MENRGFVAPLIMADWTNYDQLKVWFVSWRSRLGSLLIFTTSVPPDTDIMFPDERSGKGSVHPATVLGARRHLTASVHTGSGLANSTWLLSANRDGLVLSNEIDWAFLNYRTTDSVLCVSWC